MKNPSSKPHSPSTPKGFALVVTLSLMILLTVIAVGLLTLSSISLRSSNASMAMAEARENARMALMLAIGELQKQAGPDQRVTAIADIAGTVTGDSLAVGAAPSNNQSINAVPKGLTKVQSGTRHWTGVWKNSNTTNPGDEIFTKTPSPSFIQWLVSGNEGSTGVGPFTPESSDCDVGNSGSVSDPKTAVVLVGKNTTGDPSTGLARYVAAPLVTITRPNGSSTKPSGRYAWWIGDEGVKARINIGGTVTDGTYAALTAQRRGWETVAGFVKYPSPTAGIQADLPKATDVLQAGLLDPSFRAETAGTSPLQSAFHSATADSRAVLADTLNGGTKIDLTTILSNALPTSVPANATTITNYPKKGTNIIPPITAAATSTMVAPKWDALKAFYDRSSTLSSGALVVKAATSNAEASIAPLITDIRILMGVHFVRGTSNAGEAYLANPCGKFAVAIANPYSKPLKWNQPLEFEVREMTPTGNDSSHIYGLRNKDNSWNSRYISAAKPAVFNNAFFRIGAGTLAPGEARAYTVSGNSYRTLANGTTRAAYPLAPFDTSGASDFKKCVELESLTYYPYLNTSTPPKLVTMSGLGVGESFQTSLIRVEMREAGSGAGTQPLRRVDRFELDNAYLPTKSYTPAQCGQRTDPIPLMCYSFQISQPGVDYVSGLPGGYQPGQRGSTLRTFMDFNLQATRVGKPIASYNPPPYFMDISDSFAQLPDTPPGGLTGSAFTKNLQTTMPWGRAASGSQTTVLFGVPSQFTSLAQFQHADLTGDDIEASIGHQPGNAFANSYATPFVKRGLTGQRRVDYELKGRPNFNETTKLPRNYYDISYLLNAALWDTYFLSSIPASGAPVPLNPSLIALDPANAAADLRDPVKCAPQLMIDGAFNVNSTDKNAWKAFLASAKHFKHPVDTSSSTSAAFPRSLEQISLSTTPPTGSGTDSFSGYRRLSDTELDAVATEMVKQVRMRGPFLSLSHFVNRALQEIIPTGGATAQPALTRSGALQAANDESGININFVGNKNAFSTIDTVQDAVTLRWKNGAPRADMDGGKASDKPDDVDSSHPDWATTSLAANYGAVASIVADQDLLKTPQYQREQGYRSTGIPGWLTQADVLQVIGSSITTRSDTFRIRTYGESLDASGNTVAKAYCEAILQREPDYVDPSDASFLRGSSLNPTNQTYGRKFKIVSFRWMSPQEI